MLFTSVSADPSHAIMDEAPDGLDNVIALVLHRA
jgi:hypothetical protein